MVGRDPRYVPGNHNNSGRFETVVFEEPMRAETRIPVMAIAVEPSERLKSLWNTKDGWRQHALEHFFVRSTVEINELLPNWKCARSSAHTVAASLTGRIENAAASALHPTIPANRMPTG